MNTPTDKGCIRCLSSRAVKVYNTTNVAHQNNKSHQQCCYVSTLFPASMLVCKIQAIIPKATWPVIRKPKKLVSKKHVWLAPALYECNAINEGGTAAAVSFNIVDNLDCPLQRSRSRDVKEVTEGDRKVKKVKRYIPARSTRSTGNFGTNILK